jgi:hypothetical protein
MEEMSSHPEPSRTMNRRRLLCSGLKAGCAPFLISRLSSAQQIRNDSPRSGEALKIADLEFIELTGHIDVEAGVNEQYQVNPLDVYEELRRPPYKDVPGGTRRRAIKSIYLQLKTAEGVNGITVPSTAMSHDSASGAALLCDRQRRIGGRDALGSDVSFEPPLPRRSDSDGHQRSG